MAKKIRVLIVDDSSLMRKILKQALESSPDFEVVGAAIDPFEARDLLVELHPDVMTLDLEMPKMDGLTFLEKVMSHLPTRVVVVSALAQSGSQAALRALELGAVEVVAKPSIEVLKDKNALEEAILSKVRAAAKAKMAPTPLVAKPTTTRLSGDVDPNVHLIAITSSTGGTEALKQIFNNLPANFPPIVVVQHMPPGFTKTYADNLNKKYPFEVKEAEQGDKLLPNRILIAPGDFHMEVKKTGSLYSVVLHQDVPKHSVRPAAEYLMSSVAKYAGDHAIGVVLTGMGKDGAHGLLEMKKAGAFNIAQSEKTCVVYGMPAAAVAAGAIHQTLDLSQIGEALAKRFLKSRAAS
jgi:two-component system chemotaxis response regulator CheB